MSMIKGVEFNIIDKNNNVKYIAAVMAYDFW